MTSLESKFKSKYSTIFIFAHGHQDCVGVGMWLTVFCDDYVKVHLLQCSCMHCTSSKIVAVPTVASAFWALQLLQSAHIQYTIFYPAKWLRNLLVTESHTFHNDDKGHRICIVITLIVVEDLIMWSTWHWDNLITCNTLEMNKQTIGICTQLKIVLLKQKVLDMKSLKN